MTNNKALLKWIDEIAQMTKPDKIVWIDGSQEENDRLATQLEALEKRMNA